MRHTAVMTTSNDDPRRVTRSEVIRLADLATVSDIVEDRRFEDCMLVGPAVLVLLDSVDLISCGFEGSAEAMLWELPADRTQVQGAIGLRRCSFIGCRFQRVGFAGTPEVMEMFRRSTATGPGEVKHAE